MQSHRLRLRLCRPGAALLRKLEYPIDGGSWRDVPTPAKRISRGTPCDCEVGVEPNEYYFDFEVDITGLAPGSHRIEVQETDSHGLDCTASNTFEQPSCKVSQASAHQKWNSLGDRPLAVYLAGRPPKVGSVIPQSQRWMKH